MTANFSHASHKIHWPSAISIVGHIAALVLLSQLVILFDNARGMAYILLPVLLASSLLRESNITWKHHFKIKATLWSVALLWISAGFLVLTQIISMEDGAPLYESGLIYELAAILANENQPAKN